MKQGNFILGIALLLVAATLAITITFRNAPDAAEPQQITDGGRTTKGTTERRHFKPAPPNEPLAAKLTKRAQRAKAEDLEITIDPNQVENPTASHVSELTEQASEVRREALQKLDQMTERFALTQDQRRQILPLLMKSTAGFDPAMVISDTSTGAPLIALNSSQSADEGIHEALDPEQQQEFEQDAIDKNLWWNDVVAQLEEDYDSSVENLPIAATAPPDLEEPTDNASDGGEDSTQQGGNIFDLIEQN